MVISSWRRRLCSLNFRLSLKEDPSLYFELVRDVNPETGEENGEWSIHFKTGNGLPTHTNLTES